MREILIDTETTGFSPKSGHRIIELACVEVIDGNITGGKYHQYINPERDLDADAEDVHGITADFLQDKPVFKQVVDEILDFIGDATLVAHNASFDIDFLNSEMDLIGRDAVDKNRVVVDTLVIARKCFPEQKNNLEALCRRLNVDHHRDSHGALLDAEILARVYLKLRQL